MLADKVDHSIGVDTHNHSHTIAVVSPAGAAIEHRTVPATTHTHRLPSATCTATGSPSSRRPGAQAPGLGDLGAPAATGAGLTAYLLEQGEWVVEIDRSRPPGAPQRRHGR